MKRAKHVTARQRQAARRRLSRFTNSRPAREPGGVVEAREPRFAAAPASSVRMPTGPRFIEGPAGWGDGELPELE